MPTLPDRHARRRRLRNRALALMGLLTLATVMAAGWAARSVG